MRSMVRVDLALDLYCYFAYALSRQACPLIVSFISLLRAQTSRDYFAQRIQESRNQALLRSQSKAMEKATVRPKATDNYFARRIEECRQRTLMVSLEAAKAARERANANAAGKRILFSPIRTPSAFYSAVMPR